MMVGIINLNCLNTCHNTPLLYFYKCFLIFLRDSPNLIFGFDSLTQSNLMLHKFEDTNLNILRCDLLLGGSSAVDCLPCLIQNKITGKNLVEYNNKIWNSFPCLNALTKFNFFIMKFHPKTIFYKNVITSNSICQIVRIIKIFGKKAIISI